MACVQLAHTGSIQIRVPALLLAGDVGRQDLDVQGVGELTQYAHLPQPIPIPSVDEHKLQDCGIGSGQGMKATSAL